MPNLQALTDAEAMRFHESRGYALGRFDERDGPYGTRWASEIAADFGCYTHDEYPRVAIADAWRYYVADLEVLALAADRAMRQAVAR